MTTSRLPRLADDLIDESLRCPCDETDGPLCARCECLVELAHAIDIYAFEQMAGVPWHVAAPRIRQADQLPPLGALHGLWYTMMTRLLQLYWISIALCWGLKRAWRRGLRGRTP